MEPIIVILAGAFFIAVVVQLFLRYERKRSEALQLKASTLDFSYTNKAELEEIGAAGQFHLYKMGRRKRIRNLMMRGSNDVQTRIYDYQFTTGGGQSSHTYNQTVFQFESGALHLPAFSLRPENIFHKIGESLGYRDIDFESYPEFSNKYLLKGDDEEAIRKLFKQEVITRFEAEKGLIVEGRGRLMICYRSGKRVKPDDLWTVYESMQTLARIFIRRCGFT